MREDMTRRKQEARQKGSEVSFEIVGVPETYLEQPVISKPSFQMESPKPVFMQEVQ